MERQGVLVPARLRASPPVERRSAAFASPYQTSNEEWVQFRPSHCRSCTASIRNTYITRSTQSDRPSLGVVHAGVASVCVRRTRRCARAVLERPRFLDLADRVANDPHAHGGHGSLARAHDTGGSSWSPAD